jgi:hypothetical protein
VIVLENDVGNEMFLEASKDNHKIDSKKSPIYQFLEILVIGISHTIHIIHLDEDGR